MATLDQIIRSKNKGRAPGRPVNNRGTTSAIRKPKAAGSRGPTSAIRKSKGQPVGRAPGRTTRVLVVGGASGGRPQSGGRAQTDGECLIGAETDIKSAAGFVCAGVRNNSPPEVKAISANNVNQALKTLAIAHDYLEEEDLDLYAQVDFPDFATNQSGAKAVLHVFKKVGASTPPTGREPSHAFAPAPHAGQADQPVQGEPAGICQRHVGPSVGGWLRLQ